MSTEPARRILAITGNRADYDLLQPVLEHLTHHRRYDIGVAVTGAHLSPNHGMSVREVERDGYPVVARIEGLLSSNSLSGRARSAAVELLGLTEAIDRFDPAFVVLLGDREEALAGAIAAGYARRAIVHLGGGDTASDGNIDNAARHAITRFAHLHMTATAESARRLERMGEEPWRISHVGATGVDRMLRTEAATSEELWQHLGASVPTGPYAVVVQHPTMMDAEDAADGIQATLDALTALDIVVVVGRPNSDPGNHAMAAAINRHVASHPRFRTYDNLDRRRWVCLLREAGVLVGNSSAGIIEAPALGLPVVNVGMRQRGREHAANVQFVDPVPDQIRDATRRALEDVGYRDSLIELSSPYGRGDAAQLIIDILDRTAVDERLLTKHLTY